MNINPYMQAYDFTGQSFLLTGAGGVLGGAMARALFECGADVAILDYNLQAAQNMADSFIPGPGTGRSLVVQANVLEAETVKAAVDQTLAAFGKLDGLVNAAGGNKPAATTGPDKSFFDLPTDAMRWVFDLNLLGTIIPSQIVGRHMAERQQGVILNISSMNSFHRTASCSPMPRPVRSPPAASRSSTTPPWDALASVMTCSAPSCGCSPPPPPSSPASSSPWMAASPLTVVSNHALS